MSYSEGKVKPTILLVGGGTGGHITPLLAIARQLKELDSGVKLVYVGERGGKFGHLAAEDKSIDDSHFIFAGKFRRYHGQSTLEHIIDVKTVLLNIRDAFFVLIGTFQSLWLIGRLKPDNIFIKGGFVGVPVGVAARIRRRSFITHDSDTMPGLANRIVGRWASLQATGMPAEFYNYESEKIRFVGVPLAESYKPVDSVLKKQYRKQLKLPQNAFVIFVTGASLGSRAINKIVQKNVKELLQKNPDLVILHQVGKGNLGLYEKLNIDNDRLRIYEFLTDMHKYSGAADLVITRGSATNLAELGVQQKPVIIIPSPFLAGGHQLNNAANLAEKEAAYVLDEHSLTHDPKQLGVAIDKLARDQKLRNKLALNLSKLVKGDAARELAKMLMRVS